MHPAASRAPDHVCSYDFVEERTHDGRKFRMLNIIDEFTHECLAIRVSRRLKSIDVIDVLSDLFILRGVPGNVRSDNGPEVVAKAVQEWIGAAGAKTAYITPGSPWENGFIESFNARLRDELLNGRSSTQCAQPRPSSRAGAVTTTREGNAHRTDKSDEREVLYPWHPWAGCTVYVHETVEKTAGTALRCSRDGGAPERWLPLPVWMFDRAACLLMRIARDPQVDLAALS